MAFQLVSSSIMSAFESARSTLFKSNNCRQVINMQLQGTVCNIYALITDVIRTEITCQLVV